MIKKGIFLIFVLLLFPILTNYSQALQQVAGPLVYTLNLGETKTLQWGLVSDEDKPITLTIGSDGKGSELISFPKTITIQPKEYAYVNVTVTIPADYTNNVKLSPSVYATQYGEQGGSTELNLRMQKVLTINIGNPPAEQTIPEFPTGIAVLLISISFLILISSRSRFRI